MKTNPGDVAAQARDTAGLVQPEIRTCPACGTQFPASGDSGLCPVCILREAAGEESAATGIPIASQGGSIEQAMHNLKEAVEGFFEVASPAEIETRLKRPALFTHFEVSRA